MTFAEIATPGSYRALPLIPRDQVEHLWLVDWYDGPKAGALLFNGEKCWYKTVNDSLEGPEPSEDQDVIFRHAVVIRLNPEQLAEEEKWNELFKEKVGWGAHRRPKEMHAEFFEPYSKRVPRDFSKNEVLGWIELL